MRKFSSFTAFAFSLAAFVYLIAMTGKPAPATADSSLTGDMAPMQFLVGSWDCGVKIAAMNGQPASTDHGTLTYSVVPGNALHSHVTANDYADDSYTGYVDKSKMFWMNTIDAYENLTGETSTDGKIFSGSTTGSDGKKEIRDTLSRPTSKTIRDLQEYQIDGAWHMATDAVCTRM
jgi:hypothetical protein